MALLRFLFDGQPDGTAATIANTGASLVSTSGGTATFSTSAGMNGTTGLRFNSTQAANTCLARFAFSATSNQVQTSVVVTTPASAPANNAGLMTLRHSSGRCLTVGWGSSGSLYLYDAGAIFTIVASAGVLSLNTKYRISLQVTGGSTTEGTVLIKIYTATGTAPIATALVEDANLTTNAFSHVQIGEGGIIYATGFDELQINDGPGGEIPAYQPGISLAPLANQTVEPETIVSLSAVLDGTAPGVLSILHSKLALAASAPVALAFAGSSTTAGTGASTAANRYVNRVTAALRANYPNGGSESAIPVNTSATFTKITTPGIHSYNLGEGGTTAANFFSEAERTNVAALNPAVVFIMIGSNDYSFNVTPATYKTNLQTVLQDLRTKTPETLFILIHSYQRLDVTGTYAWSQYRTVLSELMNESPNDTYLIDVSPDFAAQGVPGADPNNLIGSDNIHATDAGYQLLSDSIMTDLAVNAATTFTWRRVSGATVTLAGSGANCTFRAPSGMPPSGTSVTIGVTASNGSTTSPEVTAIIASLPQIRWAHNGTTWVGQRPSVGL